MSGPRLVVGVGAIVVHPGPARLVTLGLGSCVAIMLHDPGSGAGALAHVLLPTRPEREGLDRAGRYASAAPIAMAEALAGLGAPAGRLLARLAGGAAMFTNLASPGSIQVGERNVVAAREALRAAGIPLVGESVGGTHGRNVEFDLPSGRILVTSYAHPAEEL